MDSKEEQKRRLEMGLKMIAVTRLFLPDVNIAATTALQALHPLGRELGLKAGANVLMPIVTVPSSARSTCCMIINLVSMKCRNSAKTASVPVSLLSAIRSDSASGVTRRTFSIASKAGIPSPSMRIQYIGI